MLKTSPDLREDTAHTVVVVPDDGEVWAGTLSCTVRKPSDGSELAAPTVTVDSVSTTLATVTDAESFTVDDPTGITRGSYYQVTADGVPETVQVSEIDGASVRLAVPMTQTPAASDTFKGIELSFALTATHTADRARNYNFRITDSADAYRTASGVLHVVRVPFVAPITTQEIRRYIFEVWGATLPHDEYESHRSEIERRMRARLLQSAWYADQVWDREALRPAALDCLRLILAERGMVPPGFDAAEYREEQQTRWERTVGLVVHGLAAYDEDDDNAVDDDTPDGGAVRGVLWSR